MGLPTMEVRLFSLFNIEEGRYTDVYQLDDVSIALGAPRAAVIVFASIKQLNSDELRDMANIKYPNGKPGEGIVIRATDSSWSFKVINLEYRD